MVNKINYRTMCCGVEYGAPRAHMYTVGLELTCVWCPLCLTVTGLGPLYLALCCLRTI